MGTASIIALVDAEIERLENARNLLIQRLSVAPVAASRQRRRTNKQDALSATSIAPALSETPPHAPAVQLIAVPLPAPIQKLPPRRQRQGGGRSVSRREAAPIALTAFAPTGPVAVSAEEVRRARERAAQAEVVRVQPEPLQPEGSGPSLGSLIRAFERRSAAAPGREEPDPAASA